MGQLLLVTNRHVFQGQKSVVIRLKENTTGELKEINMILEENGQALYSTHDDEKVDIAAIFLDGNFVTANDLQCSGFNLEVHAIPSYDLVKQGGDEGSYVYMLGFPMGLVNIDSNTPICRGGCIARIDETEIRKTKQFLLDIQNFPGNSGSPIIIKPEIYGIGDDPVLNKSVLIGIVRGYIPYKEELINTRTHEIVEIRSENSGIAVVHPVEFIKEVVDKEIKRFYSNLTE